MKPVINVFSDVNSGSIKGNIIDEISKAPIKDVFVQVFSSDGVIDYGTTQTNIDGDFLKQGLEAGSYILIITYDGYQDLETETIPVKVGEVAEIEESIMLVLE